MTARRAPGYSLVEMLAVLVILYAVLGVFLELWLVAARSLARGDAALHEPDVPTSLAKVRGLVEGASRALPAADPADGLRLVYPDESEALLRLDGSRLVEQRKGSDGRTATRPVAPQVASFTWRTTAPGLVLLSLEFRQKVVPAGASPLHSRWPRASAGPRGPALLAIRLRGVSSEGLW